MEMSVRDTVTQVVVCSLPIRSRQWRPVSLDEILHFSLPGLLPQGERVALDRNSRTLSLLRRQSDRLWMGVQKQFSLTEMSVLVPMLEMYPYYCPYEVMHASFYYGSRVGQDLTRSRERLRQARESAKPRSEMRPVSEAVSRTRLKLCHFALDIRSIRVAGYLLLRARSAWHESTGGVVGLVSMVEEEL